MGDFIEGKQRVRLKRGFLRQKGFKHAIEQTWVCQDRSCRVWGVAGKRQSDGDERETGLQGMGARQGVQMRDRGEQGELWGLQA